MPQERWIVVSLIALLGYSAWARGGTVAILQPPLVLLGLVLLALSVIPRALRRDEGPAPVGPRRLLGDPLFLPGLAFLALLFIQWANGGRTLVYDPSASAWCYTAPRIAWLASSISRRESAEMFVWFFPAWAAMLCVRSGRISREGLRTVFLLMAANAAALALFGVVQRLSGTDSIFWIRRLECGFFASFGYENHAGAFFTLMFSLACGLLAREVLGRRGALRTGRLGALAACALLSFLGANLSLSRAAIALSWAMMFFVAAYLVWNLWPKLRPVGRVYVLLGVAIAILAGGLLVIGMGGEAIRQQEWDMAGQHRSANPLGGEWALMRSAAFRMWQAHPWVGVGGWGFRYLLGWYIPPELWGKIRVGDASVHNDALQFLSEFGLIGCALLAWAVAVPFVAVLRARGWRRPLVLIALAGLAMTVVQSMIDLPFRCPAVLYAWAVILAALPALSVKPPALKTTMMGDAR